FTLPPAPTGFNGPPSAGGKVAEGKGSEWHPVQIAVKTKSPSSKSSGAAWSAKTASTKRSRNVPQSSEQRTMRGTHARKPKQRRPEHPTKKPTAVPARTVAAKP